VILTTTFTMAYGVSNALNLKIDLIETKEVESKPEGASTFGP
jgi:hypothetical protein